MIHVVKLVPSLKNPSLDLDEEFVSSSMSNLSGSLVGHKFYIKFLKLLQLFQNNHQQKQEYYNKTMISLVFFI